MRLCSCGYRSPEATKLLCRLSEGPVEFDKSILKSRGKLSSLLAAGKVGRLGRSLTTTGSESERREAVLSFMSDQGLVTLGPREDTLVFANAVAKVCVNEAQGHPREHKWDVGFLIRKVGRRFRRVMSLGP